MKAKNSCKKLAHVRGSRGQKPCVNQEAFTSSRTPYIPSNAKFSEYIDISDNNKLVITGTISERELRDAYLEWCMRRHGSEVIVSAMIGVSRKSVYNHIKRINGR